MQLLDIIIPTGTAHAGMKVAEVFAECVARNVPGIPFVNDAGRVVGRVSIRHTLKMTCIPEYMVKGAHLLGDAIDPLTIKDDEIRYLLDLPVDGFVLEDIAHLSARSPIVKALSMMEHFNSGYIFLCDNDQYRGIVTRMGIARLLLQSTNPKG